MEGIIPKFYEVETWKVLCGIFFVSPEIKNRVSFSPHSVGLQGIDEIQEEARISISPHILLMRSIKVFPHIVLLRNIEQVPYIVLMRNIE